MYEINLLYVSPHYNKLALSSAVCFLFFLEKCYRSLLGPAAFLSAQPIFEECLGFARITAIEAIQMSDSHT